MSSACVIAILVSGADWNKISGREISHSFRPSHTPTNNFETGQQYFLYGHHHRCIKKFKFLGWGRAKYLKVIFWTSIFLFSLFIFPDISLSLMCMFTFFTNFLAPVTFPSTHLHLVAKQPPHCNLFIFIFVITFILEKNKYYIVLSCQN